MSPVRASVAGLLLAGLAALPPALAQGQGGQQAPKKTTYYEAFKRQRLLNCMKDEIVWQAYCVKKCTADFRMDTSNNPPLCIATKADAKYDPPKPGYVTPAKPPARIDFGKTGA